MQLHSETRCPVLAAAVLAAAVLAAAALAAAGCQRPQPAPPAPEASAAPAASGAPAASAAPAAAAGAATPAAPAPAVHVCSLLSAAEVSAVMGKTLVQGKGGGCDYGLDPAVKEKQLAQSREAFAGTARHAGAKGGMNAFLQGMAQGGAKPPRLGAGMAGMAGMGAGIMDQMTISVSANRDDQTEAAVKAIYAKTGEVVRGALAPERHGLNGVIEGLDEIGGVGDWAFATNVAAVNMGMGFTVRGRLLEARKGPWHVTVGATVSPDPGVAALDGRLADLARALMAKL